MHKLTKQIEHLRQAWLQERQNRFGKGRGAHKQGMLTMTAEAGNGIGHTLPGKNAPDSPANQAEIAYNSKFAIYRRNAAEAVRTRRGAGCNWTSMKFRSSFRTGTRFC